MKKLLYIFIILSLCLWASLAHAQEIKVDAFTLTLPQDWSIVTSDNKNNVTVLIVGQQSRNILVALTLRPSKKPSGELATLIAKNMGKQGWSNEAPITKGTSALILGKHQEQQMFAHTYVTSNGARASIISYIVPANKPELVKDCLAFVQKNLTIHDPSLFPKEY